MLQPEHFALSADLECSRSLAAADIAAPLHRKGREGSAAGPPRACGHLRREVLAQSVATVRYKTLLGDQLQIDFGTVRVTVGDEPLKVHLFVATLGYPPAPSLPCSCTSASRRGCKAWNVPSGTSKARRRRCS
ncbi:hypothetical protein [Variovorax sp. PBS-H4]|uniref:hypothetical protein n=1 Tax=Variovorax sp. PBS-H4 TaxID=434008 RepID=UPI0013A54F3F|nr:hypothetical protein [Variovorax sp. PBS-H4]